MYQSKVASRQENNSALKAFGLTCFHRECDRIIHEEIIQVKKMINESNYSKDTGKLKLAAWERLRSSLNDRDSNANYSQIVAAWKKYTCGEKNIDNKN